MRWKQIDKYHAKFGVWTLAKCFVVGTPRYMLYEGKQLVCAFDSSDEAMKWVLSRVPSAERI